jgi:uncharacterized protein YybS (DUF2232 family)
MTWPEDGHQQKPSFLSIQVLLITASFFVPVALPSLFGWMNGLLAVPVFLLLIVSENHRTAFKQIRNGLFLAAGGALLLKQLPLMLFGLTMLPLGYMLYHSVKHKELPAISGGKGIVALGLSWFVFWMISGTLAGINPYTSLLTMLDESFARILEIYRTNTELSPDVLLGLETIIGEIRSFLPKVLPGFLAGSIVFTVWLNMVIGNRLLTRLQPEKCAWPQYKFWQLPDFLVWLPICAAVLSLVGSGMIRNTGYCLVIVAAIIYFFQGLSLFVFYLDKFNVPVLLRYVIYGILAVQSYGLVLLSVAGLADTWFDFRKLNQNEQINNSL